MLLSDPDDPVVSELSVRIDIDGLELRGVEAPCKRIPLLPLEWLGIPKVLGVAVAAGASSSMSISLDRAAAPPSLSLLIRCSELSSWSRPSWPLTYSDIGSIGTIERKSSANSCITSRKRRAESGRVEKRACSYATRNWAAV